MLHPPLVGELHDVDDLLRVAVEPAKKRGTSVVRVTGEIDHYTAPLLTACLFPRIRRGAAGELVVDLEKVTFLGAAGLSVLARAAEQCESYGVRLVVRGGAGRAVLRPLQLAGLSWLLQGPGSRRRPPRQPHHRVPSVGTARLRSADRTIGASSS